MAQTMSKKTRRPGYWRRILLAVLIELGVVALLIMWVGLPWYLADRTVHPPRVPLGSETPADYGMAFEDVRFNTTDGVRLSAWFIPGSNGAAVIILHGAPGNRTSHFEQASLLHAQGYSVLMADQRGEGASEGDGISLTGEDARAAVRYLESRGNPVPRIGILGYSLGAYNAVQAAADLPQVRAIVCDGIGATQLSDEPPPPTLGDYFMVPAYWFGYQVWLREGATGPRSTQQAIQQLNGQAIFLITGGKNSFEAAVGRKYFAAANEPKILWEIPEADHTGGWNARKGEYSQRMLAFFEKYLLGSF